MREAVTTALCVSTLSVCGLGSVALAQSGAVQSQSVVTVLSKNAESQPALEAKDFKVQVNGKTAQISNVTPLRGDRAALELAVLIDGGARNSLGRQLDDIQKFVQSLPPTTKVAISYMQNGRAVFATPFTADKAAALKGLHLPGGMVGSSASPYFCISDLAKNWPSTDRDTRREAVVITDGFDPYNPRFDPDDPYLQTAISDAVKAGVVIHGIFWHDAGFASRTFAGTNTGQNLMSLVTDATGGYYYYQGFGNPVSFSPFFADLERRLENQYELNFLAPAKNTKPEVGSLKVKLEAPSTKLTAADRVLLPPVE
ncbi:hypothetical protein [Silvibacterium dinghuense]|uniref:VWFA domain-containing protein n=1 Tax=Silvibacterium dinghuense TaxID=1560006 RepID=A0A4Q1SE79_9BACT|nr:hypothetical protein [Silvibacterium dinghuense]RXS95566.1 hypothetical protein ESZ00_13455 [Silvibacterium dinghuense]